MMEEYLLNKRLVKIFNEVWDTVTEVMVWNHYWSTGYGLLRMSFNHPAYPLWVKRNTIEKMVDHWGRKYLVVGTSYGSLAVYMNDEGMIEIKAHPEVMRIGELNEKVNEVELRWILGYDDGVLSLSQYIDDVFELL
jgi:hypothetical protein